MKRLYNENFMLKNLCKTGQKIIKTDIVYCLYSA